MKNIIGIDVGGTKILTSKFKKEDYFSPPLQTIKIPTDAKSGPQNILKNILELIETVRDKDTIGIGIAWAGFIDSDNGIIKKSPNISDFDEIPLKKILEEKLKIPVFIENDARLFSLAEQKNSSKKESSFLGIILGTGVGSGLILNGKIFAGSHGFAGEIGHQKIYNPISKTWEEVENLFSGTALSQLFGQKLEIIEAQIKNNPKEKEIIFKKMGPIIELFSLWLLNLSYAFDPQKIILGGGAGQHFWPYFLPLVVASIQNLLSQNEALLNFNLEIARLENAGSVGAALFADAQLSF